VWFTQSDASVRAGIVVAEVPSLAAFPTLHWTRVVLGCDPDVVRAVEMGFLASSLYAGAGSLRPDVIRVPQKALHPNSPERGACAPLGLGLLMRRFFPRWHWLEGGSLETGIVVLAGFCPRLCRYLLRWRWVQRASARLKNRGKRKTNHDFHRGSLFGRTAWAS